MQLELGVTSGMQLTQITELAATAQKSCLTNIWVGEDISRGHDVFTVTGIIMQKYQNLNAGIGITSPLVRNITTIARASVTLKEIGGNRSFKLGLGIGGLQDLAKLKITPKNPKCTLRTATSLLRRIWKGETFSSKKQGFSIDNFHSSYGLGYQIPVYFGVRGPALLGLAGEAADGVILSGPKTYLKKAVKLVYESLTRSRHPQRHFSFAFWAPTILTERQRDLNLAKRTVAFVLVDTPQKVLEMAELKTEKITEIRAAYHHQGIVQASQLVTDDLIEELSIHGSSTQICEAFHSLEQMPLQEAIFGPPYGANPQTALAKVAEDWKRFS